MLQSSVCVRQRSYWNILFFRFTCQRSYKDEEHLLGLHYRWHDVKGGGTYYLGVKLRQVVRRGRRTWTSGECGTRELGLCTRNKIIILRMELSTCKALVEIQTNKQSHLHRLWLQNETQGRQTRHSKTNPEGQLVAVLKGVEHEELAQRLEEPWSKQDLMTR